MTARLYLSALSLEIRKLISYRVEFWIRIFLSVIIHVTIAYFIWSALFFYNGVTEMKGYSFLGIVLYSLLAPVIANIIRAHDNGNIAQDIYEGTLTRYLIYPISFLGMKFVQHSALSIFFLFQLFLVSVVFWIGFGIPSDVNLSFFTLFQCIVICVFASVVHFLIASFLEQVAFWADNVWSLNVALRFTVHFLGGVMIPLSFFPDWALSIIKFTPFPYLIYLPVQTLLGKSNTHDWAVGILVLTFWLAALTFMNKAIWKRGTRIYTGVGI